MSQGKQQQRLARQRAQEALAAQRRSEARRKRMIGAGVAVGVVVLIAGILVGVKLSSGGSKSGGPAATAASDAVISQVTAVPAATLDSVAKGKVTGLPKLISGQPVIKDGGKPLVVYVGAEYCPYCAAERWAMVVALSRFGTFTDLGQTTSSSQDVYPSTPTLSFHGSTYTSKYLSFQGVETQSNKISGGSYATLDTPTQQQKDLMNKFNAPPYVPSSSAGSIPFIDFANQALVSGSSYSPQLFAGKTAEQVAAALSDPSSDIARAVDGAANAFTSILCSLTGDQPASVCGSAAAQAYKGSLGG